jgi:hypothetical protein
MSLLDYEIQADIESASDCGAWENGVLRNNLISFQFLLAIGLEID